MKYIALFLTCFFITSAWASPYAEVDGSGNVVNIIEWDGVTQFTPPAGISLVIAGAGAAIGGTYLNSTFSAPTPQAPTPAQQAAAAIAAGVIVTSTATPSLNGTYGLDPTSQNNVGNTVISIMLNGTFPNGSSTMLWVDQSGVSHIWPSVTEFKAFATAYSSYVSAVDLYAASNGASGALPSNSVTIP